MADVRKIRNDKTGPVIVEKLKGRGFDAYYCSTKEDAMKQALELMPEGSLVSWGGCKSVEEIGLLDYVRTSGKFRVLDRDTAKTPEERVEIMRQGLLADIFLSGTNAMTEDGELVNIDGNGNRVAAMVYGPKSVIVVAGMNKVEKTVMDAASRARNTAAPINAQRFEMNTPCKIDGMCHDCNVPDCVCCYIVRTRRSRPAGRIKVILVGEDLGF